MPDTEAITPRRVDSATELAAAVDGNDRLLVAFHTEGCSACAAMEPVLGIVARETETPVVTVNPRDDPVLIEEYQIESVPALVLFEDGSPVRRLAEGFVGAERVIDFLD
ncbi:thioredoxin family protein [Haloplanus pelagicus]|jgi:thioredoxin-like negative regulator of GroEL|uniref:thioredoxin family protein n=1 Tax=Haloplanus pelagicus TaxID=2949995 RepID=UPI0020403760|nr:thioredoxin family protein [Haloplanus sp. HW8-1]